MSGKIADMLLVLAQAVVSAPSTAAVPPWTDVLTALATAAGVAIAAGAGWFAIVSAQAARRSADLAKESLELTRVSAERQLRAYVTCTSAKIISQSSPLPWLIQLDFKNTGQTPARDLRTAAALLLVPKNELFKVEQFSENYFRQWNENEYAGSAGASVHSLPAGVTRTKPIGEDGAFRQDWVMGLIRGEAEVHVVGEGRYTDVFDVPRRFRFHYADGVARFRGEGEMNMAPTNNWED